MKIIKGHWFRADRADEPCLLHGCGRPQAEHVESVGEWMEPRHLFRPGLRSPVHCADCDRRWGHSTHTGSKKNRSLHWDRWNYFWGYFKAPKCHHRSHRLRLPCLKAARHDGLCERHFDTCWEG